MIVGVHGILISLHASWKIARKVADTSLWCLLFSSRARQYQSARENINHFQNHWRNTKLKKAMMKCNDKSVCISILVTEKGTKTVLEIDSLGYQYPRGWRIIDAFTCQREEGHNDAITTQWLNQWVSAQQRHYLCYMSRTARTLYIFVMAHMPINWFNAQI